jgi:hypothetical protein
MTVSIGPSARCGFISKEDDRRSMSSEDRTHSLRQPAPHRCGLACAPGSFLSSPSSFGPFRQRGAVSQIKPPARRAERANGTKQSELNLSVSLTHSNNAEPELQSGQALSRYKIKKNPPPQR